MGKRKKQTGQSALNERLKLVIKSGKWVIGWNETLRSVRQVNITNSLLYNIKTVQKHKMHI